MTENSRSHCPSPSTASAGPSSSSSTDFPTDNISMDFDDAEEPIVEVLGNGEMADDEDFVADDDSQAVFDADPTSPPPSKVPKPSQTDDVVTSRKSRHDCLRLVASPTDLTIYATFAVSDPSLINEELFRKFLGTSIKYFTGFKVFHPSDPLVWVLNLSEKGLTRFCGSAHAAITRIGHSIVL